MHIKNIKVNLKENRNKICSFLTNKEKKVRFYKQNLFKENYKSESRNIGKRTNKK